MLKNFHLHWLCLTTLAGSIGRRSGSGTIGILLYPFKLFACMIFLAVVELSLRSQGKIIIFLYAWFRNLDDIIDGDISAPGQIALSDFLDERKSFITQLYYRKGKYNYPHDKLIIAALSQCDLINLEIRSEIVGLWETMMADYYRRVNNQLSTKSWLVDQASALDNLIIGTCAKILGGNMRSFRDLMSQFPGLFTRTDWLHDMPSDFKNKIVNVPLEVFPSDFDLTKLSTYLNWQELLADSHLMKWYIRESNELYYQWSDLDANLGDNFGGVFESRTKAFIFKKVMYLWFNRSEVNARREFEGK